MKKHISIAFLCFGLLMGGTIQAQEVHGPEAMKKENKMDKKESKMMKKQYHGSDRKVVKKKEKAEKKSDKMDMKDESMK